MRLALNCLAGPRCREKVALMYPRSERGPRPTLRPPVRLVASSGWRSAVKEPLVGTPPFLALCHGNGSPWRTSSLGSGRMARPPGCPQHRSRYPNGGSIGFGPNFSQRGACASGQTGRGTWLDRIVCQGKLLLGQQFGHSSQAIRHREDQVTEPAAHLIQGCGSLQDAPSVHSLSFFISFGVRFPISRTPYDRRDCRAGDGSALGGDHDDAGAAGNQVRERDASRRTYYPSKWSSPRLRWTVGIGRTQSKES